MKTNQKKAEYIYDKLLEIANIKNIEIYTNFAGKKSVLWNLRGKKLLLINEKEKYSVRLKIICNVLKETNLEDIYLAPYIRELIDYSETKYKKQLPLKCEICKKPISKSSNQLLMLCNNCFKYQIKFGLNFENCIKKTTDKDCFDCPAYDKCNIVLERLYPNYKNLEQAGNINNPIFERIKRTNIKTKNKYNQIRLPLRGRK